MADERRPIDAEALWHKLDSEPWYNNEDRDEVALPLVDEAPTVDAVEVVRCGQCRYGEEIEDGLFLCHYEGMTWNPADHFCSYGERREDA